MGQGDPAGKKVSATFSSFAFRVSEKQRRKGLKPETRYRADKQ